MYFFMLIPFLAGLRNVDAPIHGARALRTHAFHPIRRKRGLRRKPCPCWTRWRNDSNAMGYCRVAPEAGSGQ
jgi:hypothetical protein